jgi:O-acetyl-ADP-ribose deacetylase (regulator of RNase III)
LDYVIGDATDPIGDGNKIIIHICNDIGAWGAGFVMALSKRWPWPEQSYRKWAQGNGKPFGLGHVQFVQVTPGSPDDNDMVYVANMISQRGVVGPFNPVPLDLIALDKCIQRVAEFAMQVDATVHMPRIGCGLAGGNWNEVEHIIKRFNIWDDAIVYDLEQNAN